MKLILKSIVISCFLVFPMQIVFAQDADKTVSIIVSGSGKTQDDAKQSALRSAIEQAFGAFISSKTEILNDQVVTDQIASVASGNIQSFSILNESQLPDGTWGTTLKAIVSVNKLTSFVESKGIAVEINGGLFALNIKQQILNEEAEIKAVSEMVGLLHEPMQISFDYSIKSSEPKALDGDNKNWGIDLIVTATANENMDVCANYLIKTISALSLSIEEVEYYRSLNKQVFPVEVNYKGVVKTFYLRKKNSIHALATLTRQWSWYSHLFKIKTVFGELYGPKEGELHDFGSKRLNDLKPFRINYLTKGEVAAVYSGTDTRTLNQISEMTAYKVVPYGVLSQYKYGGILVYEQPRAFRIGVKLNGNEITETTPDGAAQKAGLVKGDKIISINGINDINISNITAIINSSEKIDKLCVFVIKRNDSIVELNVFPKEVMGFSLVLSIFDLPPMEWNLAKSACEDLDLNGYNDWRLPTSEELNILYRNLYQYNYGGFSIDYARRIYWSSNENEPSGWSYQNFDNGKSGFTGSGTGSVFNVRAVRVHKLSN